MMENSKKLEFPEGQEGVRGNQGFPLKNAGKILLGIEISPKIYFMNCICCLELCNLPKKLTPTKL
jgi:hypothetical protein